MHSWMTSRNALLGDLQEHVPGQVLGTYFGILLKHGRTVSWRTTVQGNQHGILGVPKFIGVFREYLELGYKN